jgi:hypothetical protein
LNLRPGTQLQSSSKRFALVGDGNAYTEIASVFSDPIEEFPPEPSHEKGRGFVSEKVLQFENKNAHRGPPKINLVKETLKRGMKGKLKVCASTSVYSAFLIYSLIQIFQRETEYP